MERQNVTLSLSKDLLREVKHLAVERNISLSGLLNKCLEEEVMKDRKRDRAVARLKKRIHEGLNLGTGGKASWDRGELHER